MKSPYTNKSAIVSARMDTREPRNAICARSSSKEWRNTECCVLLVLRPFLETLNSVWRDQRFTKKKKKTFILRAHLQTRCNKGKRRCTLMLRRCAPTGGAGRGGKRLFVAAIRSVLDGNTRGAALRQISLPINWHLSFYSVICFNACSSGGNAGSRGRAREQRWWWMERPAWQSNIQDWLH